MIKKGFTLIELLITVAIIGILSAAVLVGINPLQKINQANDAKVKSDVGQVATAVRNYYVFYQAYPTTAQGISALVNSSELGVAPASSITYTLSGSAFSVSGPINAPQTAGDVVWCYRSAAGVAKELPSCAP
jgi:prepilin-type N-terminal cleavage/methylation domain-containing protein